MHSWRSGMTWPPHSFLTVVNAVVNAVLNEKQWSASNPLSMYCIGEFLVLRRTVPPFDNGNLMASHPKGNPLPKNLTGSKDSLRTQLFNGVLFVPVRSLLPGEFYAFRSKPQRKIKPSVNFCGWNIICASIFCEETTEFVYFSIFLHYFGEFFFVRTV